MKSTIEQIIVLIKAVENDPDIRPVRFLTDGDSDEFPPTLKALVDHFDQHGFSRTGLRELADHGYTPIRGDCLCFETTKGIVNTGVDDF